MSKSPLIVQLLHLYNTETGEGIDIILDVFTDNEFETGQRGQYLEGEAAWKLGNARLASEGRAIDLDDIDHPWNMDDHHVDVKEETNHYLDTNGMW